MGVSGVLASATVLTAAAIATVANPFPALASDEWGLNGTYIATSNGEWARTNDVFHDEQSIRSVWTISTTCSYPSECTGTVNSDWGWSAPIRQKSGVWYVRRTVPNWEPCQDGTSVDGEQLFRFIPATPDGGRVDPTSDILVGEDQTTGPSGGCGRSLPLFIKMPFKLVKQS